MSTINFAFFGTPTFSTFVLDELIKAGYTPAIVVTTPDKPAGRGLSLMESPIKKFALSNNIPVIQPNKIDSEFISSLQTKNLDLLIVAAYGKILPTSLLSVSKYPPLNVHPALLPYYRGTSPVESQILEDEQDIGVTIIQMDKEMDHGPIVAQEKLDNITWPMTREALNEILWRKGGKILSQIIPDWLEGKIAGIPQDHSRATFTKKIEKNDGLLDLSLSGRKNFLKYLAYEGWPGVFFFEDGKRIKITKAHLEDGQFVIEKVIPEGKKEVSYEIFCGNRN